MAYLGENIKKLGFGLMRLPMIGEEVGIPCTACQYCVKGCPKGVAIPGIFKAMNNYLVYNNLAGAQGNYGFETRNGGTASQCIACGQCERVCPQHIHIIDELQRAAATLEK